MDAPTVLDRLLAAGSMPDGDVSADERASLQPLFDSGILRSASGTIVVVKPTMLRACLAAQPGDRRQQPMSFVAQALVDAAAAARPELSRDLLAELLDPVLRVLIENPAALAAVLREAARHHPTDIAMDLADVATRLGRFTE